MIAFPKLITGLSFNQPGRRKTTNLCVSATFFASGTLSYIAESGSIGDYLDSLARLRCFGLQALYPGHGRVSTTPMADIDSAMMNAQSLLDERGNGGPEVFFQKVDDA